MDPVVVSATLHRPAFDFHVYIKAVHVNVTTCLTSHSAQTLLRSGVWEHVTLLSGLGSWWMGIPTLETLALDKSRDSEVEVVEAVVVVTAVCFCSWSSEKHPAHASAAALARQWQCCLAFRARGQGGASHHLPTKAQVTQPASALPHFLPSPHKLTSPHCCLGPAEKTMGFSFSPFPPPTLYSPPMQPPSNPLAFMVQYFHAF